MQDHQHSNKENDGVAGGPMPVLDAEVDRR